jgi:hypothetical protein
MMARGRTDPFGTNKGSFKRSSSSEQTLGTMKVTDYHLGHRGRVLRVGHAHAALIRGGALEMSEQPQPQRMQQTMPEEDGGWHRVNAGLHLHIMFNPNRLGRQPDEIERPSILVAVVDKREQALRFDPFSVGSHYHIRPSQRGRQIPLWVEEGQTPLDVALAFFDKPLRLRGLLAQADEDDVASQLDDADLVSAARQIRHLYASHDI